MQYAENELTDNDKYSTAAVARNITWFRQSKCLSQRELALKIGVSQQAVSKWERGLTVPDLLVVPKLLEVFEIGFNELLYCCEALIPEEDDCQLQQ